MSQDADYTAGQQTRLTGSVAFEPAITNLPVVLRMDGLSASQCQAMIVELDALSRTLVLAERRALGTSDV